LISQGEIVGCGPGAPQKSKMAKQYTDSTLRDGGKKTKTGNPPGKTNPSAEKSIVNGGRGQTWWRVNSGRGQN